MAIIKVFDSEGVKVLNCFDTLSEVPYIEPVDDTDEDVVEEKNPFE